MKLTIPFIYCAQIIKPRCRKPVSVYLRDVVEVEIKEVAEMPVGLKVGDKALRWDGQDLWDFNVETASEQEDRKVMLSEVIANTDDCSQYKWSRNGAAAPFHNFWNNVRDAGELDHLRLKDDEVMLKADVVRREWVSDNKEEVMALALEIAEGMIAINGVMHKKVSEPRYVAMTFGLSNNHGGSALFIQQYSRHEDERYFTANQKDEALAHAARVAEGRGDTKSLPMKTNCGNYIEVLIPEAVQLPVFKDKSED